MAVDRSWRWISWTILGIGALIVAGGLALGYGSLRLVLSGDRADGEVVELRREGDMYAPVVRFRLPNGRAHEVQDLASGAPDFAVGDLVTVIHAPNDPDDFRIATFDRLWLSAIFVTGFGCFWLMFGAVAWALSRDVELFVVGEHAFSLIAVAAAVIGVAASWNALTLYTSGNRTEGVVTEIRESRYTDRREGPAGSDRGMRRDVERTSYAPAIAFNTLDGRQIEFLGRGGTGGSFDVGDRVSIVYDPANPIRAHVLSFVDLWLPAVVCWGLAVLFGGSVWLSRWSRRRALLRQPRRKPAPPARRRRRPGEGPG